MTPLTDWSTLPTPALVVDIDRLERNIDEIARTQADLGIGLRPHVKTSKCLEVARRQLAAGAIGFTCSTPAEVRALTEAGIGGLLWAHLPVGTTKVDFAVEAATTHGVLLMVDSVAVAAPLARAGRERGATLDVMLEIDTGHGRTGVDPDAAVPLAADIRSLGGLRIVGVVTHEGHLGSIAPTAADREAMDSAGRQVAAVLAGVAHALVAEGHPCERISVGSTPGLTSSVRSSQVTEARPGTYVYFDANQLRRGGCTLDQCALTVLTVVVSRPAPGRAIIDAGLKAMSADALTDTVGGGIVLDVEGRPLEDIHFATANEEHGFLLGAGADRLAVGDLLRVVPNHACGTVNMWSHLYALRAGETPQVWDIVARH